MFIKKEKQKVLSNHQTSGGKNFFVFVRKPRICFFTKMGKRGQSLIEYAVILIIVMGAFLAIGNYMKRGIQGRWKQATDDLGDQYDPQVANSSVEHRLEVISSTRIQKVPDTSLNGEITRRDDNSTVRETKTGFISIGDY